MTADGVVLAQSVPTQRRVQVSARVPAGDRQAVRAGRRLPVGRTSGRSASRAKYSSELAGRTLKLADERPRRHLRQPPARPAPSCSRCRPRRSCSGRDRRSPASRGSVVVLDVQTGGVVAAVLEPDVRPEPARVSHNPKTAQTRVRLLLTLHPTNPLLARAWREIYPPGSTFKTVTAATALGDNVDVNKQFPVVRRAPAAAHDHDACRTSAASSAAARSRTSFIVSCNTTFGQVGLDLGDRFADGHPELRRADRPPPTAGAAVDPPHRARASGPKPGTFKTQAPTFAQAAIGQGPVAVTPLEMALVAESVATGGVDPRAARSSTAIEGSRRTESCSTVGTTLYKRAMRPATADDDEAVHARGREQPAAPAPRRRSPASQVAGKTGTAETAPGEQPARVVHRVRAGRRTRVRGRGARRARRHRTARTPRRPAAAWRRRSPSSAAGACSRRNAMRRPQCRQ